MRDHGALASHGIDGCHHAALGLVIECTGGLVEDDNFRVVIKRSCDADTLALPATEPDTAFSHHCIVTFWKFLDDKTMQLSRGRGGNKCALINGIIRQSEGDILADGGIGQKDGLGDVANIALPVGEVRRIK